MKQFKNSKVYAQKQNNTKPPRRKNNNALQRPPTFAAVFVLLFGLRPPRHGGSRLGGLRRRPSNTLSNNSKGNHGTKEECAQ